MSSGDAQSEGIPEPGSRSARWDLKGLVPISSRSHLAGPAPGPADKNMQTALREKAIWRSREGTASSPMVLRLTSAFLGECSSIRRRSRDPQRGRAGENG